MLPRIAEEKDSPTSTHEDGGSSGFMQTIDEHDTELSTSEADSKLDQSKEQDQKLLKEQKENGKSFLLLIV